MNDTRPNIIFIITDQQRYDTIAGLGFPFMDTPNLDRLVSEGTSFTNCHVSGASCAPARASLFSGYYPHTTGIVKNADNWTRTWIEHLNTAGYHCVNIGKMHTWPFNTPAGFHERYNVENKDRYMEGRYYFDEWDKALAARGLVKQQRELYRQLPDYADRMGAFDWELPEDMQSDMFVGNLAKWWIETYPKDGWMNAYDPIEPLFLQIGFPGPHPPFDPSTRFSEPYMDKDLPIEEVLSTDTDTQPEPFKLKRIHDSEVDHDSVLQAIHPTDAQRHRQRAFYLANITMIDQKVGEILESLEQKGYLENAIVVFTSDHGDCLGDHGLAHKWSMYEQVTRVPMIVWAPGRAESGKSHDGLMQQFDIVPALFDYAGIDVPETFECENIRPALVGNQWLARDFVYAEQARDGNFRDTYFMTMVRSEEWKLVHFLHENFGQLFNLKDDPKENVDLWNNPSASVAKSQMLDQLHNWRIESQFHTSDWTKDFR
jgi:arylsulfatase A-like enzyme